MRSIGLVVVVLVIVAGAVAVVYGVATRRGTVVQPIAFNHAVHVQQASIQCIECHKNARTGASAGLPSRTACFDCHNIAEEEGTNPEKAKLAAFQDGNADIPWIRIAVTKPDVFFSHRRHVVAAVLDCLECHPEQPMLSAPPANTQLVMTMTACIECHQRNGASTDCLACHR